MENNIITLELKNYDTYTIQQHLASNYNKVWDWLIEPLKEDNSNNEFVVDYKCKVLLKSRIEAFIETDEIRIRETERSRKFHNR